MRALYDGQIATAILTVTHSEADSVMLDPHVYTVTTGSAVAYAVQATDAYGNAWDASAGANYAIQSGAGGNWRDYVYTTEFAGTWAVTATVGAAHDTGTLHVKEAMLCRSNFTVTVTISGTGTVRRDPNRNTYACGEAVTLTATPASGWHFERWAGDLGGSNNPATLVMDSSKAITAIFEVTPTTIEDHYLFLPLIFKTTR